MHKPRPWQLWRMPERVMVSEHTSRPAARARALSYLDTDLFSGRIRSWALIVGPNTTVHVHHEVRGYHDGWGLHKHAVESQSGPAVSR